MAAFPQGYDIYIAYIANLDPTVGSEIRKTRPVVVVSRNEMNRYLNTEVVCPLTTQLHPRWRGRLQARCAGQDAEIAVDQIHVISKHRIGQRIDRQQTDDSAGLRRIIGEMYAE